MLLEIYNKFELTLARGESVYLYDDKNREFLDFSSGIGVCALGYNHKLFNQALKKQIDKLLHTSNLYFNEEADRKSVV